jgi:V8-like Glu-specific endopeptidase
MPPKDVVSHELKAVSALADIDEAEPMPLPVVRREVLARVLGKPPVTTRVDAPKIDTAPYRSVGKMYMRFNTPKWLGGSGWVVAPRAFITAGHCVYYKDKGGWVSEVRYCPRYDGTCAKQYVVERVYTFQGWIDNTDENQREYDLAACVVTEPFAPSEPPLPVDPDLIPDLRFAAVGYPGPPIPEYPFNKKRMWQALGNATKLEGSMIWAENNLTSGSSGGPWCEPNNNWIVGGITAARIDDDPNLAVSPMFEGIFEKLYDVVKNL